MMPYHHDAGSSETHHLRLGASSLQSLYHQSQSSEYPHRLLL
ncbi:Uncharacterised protein [Vibrio cholerae]|nr:Uncharacterised protein [Vibrio cholerae]